MEFTDDMISKAAKVAERHVCDRCLGRQFAKVGTGMTNDVRGALIRKELKNRGIETSVEEPCPLCEDTFDMLDRFADAVADAVNSVESENFLVGSRVEPEIANREKELQKELELEECESIKTELNREIGKLALPKIHRPVEFKTPQVVACIDTRFADVNT